MTVVVVSGVPGAGKSTLTQALAPALPAPPLTMDPVKEALWDLLGAGDVEWSRRLGRAANEVVLATAAATPAAVLDSFWRREWALDRLAELPHRVIEVFCSCPPDVARARYASRSRHPAHLDGTRLHDPDLWAPHRARPLLDDAVAVATTAPADLDGLVERIRRDPRWEPRGTPVEPTLVAVTGLPGTGKSTIASALSAHACCPAIGRDVIGAALSRTGVVPAGDPDGVAFDLMGTLAEQQLRSGSSAVLDSVGGRPGTRQRWRALAEAHGARLVVIECVCSDDGVHRERIEARRRGIPGWYEVDWSGVEEVRARYQPWGGERLVLDAVEPADANAASAVRALDAREG